MANNARTTWTVAFVVVVILVAAAAFSAGASYLPRTVTTTLSNGGTVTTTATVTITMTTTASGAGTAAEYVYQTANQSSAISARVGEMFIIKLSSNAGSTGYDWKVTTSTGIQYLNYTVVSTSNLPGGPQVRNYLFRAAQAGSQTITLQDERSFAPFAIAATIDIQVAVS